VHSISRSSLIIMPSGSTAASDQALIFGARSRGMPSRSAMTLIGIGMASSVTTSQRPRSMNASMVWSTISRICTVSCSMLRGRNGSSTIFRKRLWEGGSLVTSVSTVG
jgi:hypothetical protein